MAGARVCFRNLIVPRGVPESLHSQIELNEELSRDLIAHETRFTQVLSLPPTGQRRSSEPGQGLMALGEILRRAAALPQANGERSLP